MQLLSLICVSRCGWVASSFDFHKCKKHLNYFWNIYIIKVCDEIYHQADWYLHVTNLFKRRTIWLSVKTIINAVRERSVRSNSNFQNSGFAPFFRTNVPTNFGRIGETRSFHTSTRDRSRADCIRLTSSSRARDQILSFLLLVEILRQRFHAYACVSLMASLAYSLHCASAWSGRSIAIIDALRYNTIIAPAINKKFFERSRQSLLLNADTTILLSLFSILRNIDYTA